MSQMELALEAEISARHLSFVETGRSSPSRQTLLQLAEHLDVTPRERNRLLLAAGFAPTYSDLPLDAPQMQVIRDAVRRVLTAHEPFPALAIDRKWNVLDTNAMVMPLLDGCAAELLEPPVNVLRLSLHPRGLAPRIVNLQEWRAHLMHRLRRQIAASADPDLEALEAELETYRGDAAPKDDGVTLSDIFVPLKLRTGDTVSTFLSTVTTFGTALDVNAAEISIEALFPVSPEPPPIG